MKLSDFILENPQFATWNTSTFDSPASNLAAAKKYIGNPNKKALEQLSPDCVLYELPAEGQYVAIKGVDLPAPKLIYFVEYKIQQISYVGKSCACQIGVWRAAGNPEVAGLPKKIFFDYLLPKTGCMVTDYKQTDRGARFWMDRIGDAFSYGYHVYGINTVEPQFKKEVTNIDELDAILDELYGHDDKFQERKIIISKSPI
jgi:hypothetical protein